MKKILIIIICMMAVLSSKAEKYVWGANKIMVVIDDTSEKYSIDYDIKQVIYADNKGFFSVINNEEGATEKYVFDDVRQKLFSNKDEITEFYSNGKMIGLYVFRHNGGNPTESLTVFKKNGNILKYIH